MEANMTTEENKMYEVLAAISNTEAPIIFKGALITKLILEEQGFNQVERMTRDIDANWVGEKPTMEDLVKTIQNAIGELKNKYTVVGTRAYGELKTAGLEFFDQQGKNLFMMDVNMNAVTSGVKEYYYGEGVIKGVIVDELQAIKEFEASFDDRPVLVDGNETRNKAKQIIERAR